MTARIVVLSGVRTPIGDIGGSLSPVLALDLATHAIRGAIAAADLDPSVVEYTDFGWVAQDPRATNLARMAAEQAGVPYTAPGTTWHENCNSGGAAIHGLARRLALGEQQVGVAGGVESMSNVGRYLFGGRTGGQLYGDLKLVDGLFGALTDPLVGGGELAGLITERMVDRYGLSREEQDDIAFRSHQAALRAWDAGHFQGHVLSVEVPTKRGKSTLVTRDEHPRPLDRAQFAQARPYFKPDGGTITGLNASSLNDGAAALVLSTAEWAEAHGIHPLAELVAWRNVGVERAYMGEGAFKVIPPLLARAGVSLQDVDLFELNEAFAAVLAAAYRHLPGLSPDKVNLWGSGISLGHPVGATGARQVVDMVHMLGHRDQELGVTTRCVGGGIGGGELIRRL
ncbi:MAG: thiolase family protein [Deltaproteobacteria bacterium]|nr:thiolase family protein [Deltaproteobacteria bacterium]